MRLANGDSSVAEDEAAHVFACDACLRRLEALMYPTDACALTVEESKTIASFVASRCRSRPVVLDRLDAFVAKRQADFFSQDEGEWRLAAASDCSAVVGDGPEDVRFVFASDDATADSEAWRAELSVPGTARGGVPLDLVVKDGTGASAGDGRFSLAGLSLLVEGGAATIPFDSFLVGIRNPDVAYQRDGGNPVPGSLIFF